MRLYYEESFPDRGRQWGGCRWICFLCGLTVGLSFFLSGCGSAGRKGAFPQGEGSFGEYRREAREWLERERVFAGEDREAELKWNGPNEWRPEGVESPKKGVLLVHGLGDSPFSMSDVAGDLARRGYLVRTLLLEGHGSKPADMLKARARDWADLVERQARVMERDLGEGGELYLGGFSTGCNLAVSEALRNRAVRGVLLFSPAFKSDTSYDWLAGVASVFRPWLREPREGQQTLVRYTNVPTNGFAQFYKTSKRVRADLMKKTFERPALLVMSEHDSVVDVGRVLEFFVSRFTNPESRVIWYGKHLPEAARRDRRIIVREDYLPQYRISNFSHMGILFSPENPLYGERGTLKLWNNGQEGDVRARRLAGEEIWYSAWGYRETGKLHARLTFNPYFEWQMDMAEEVLKARK